MAKELLWKGRREEDVAQLDMQTFMELIPSRQRRTLKRGFTDAQKKLMRMLEKGADNVKTHCRNMVIIPQMLGKTLRVHNGKDFVPITITMEMLGHYLGEFAHSRKMVSHSSAGVGATRSSKAVSTR